MKGIKRIKHQDIDFLKWDKTILNSEMPFVFAQSFYLNATSPNWDALIIGDYESVFPLTHKTKFGYKYLPQPAFTSQLGIYGKTNLDIEKLFHAFIISHYRLIEIELNSFNKLEANYTHPKNTYYIDYNHGYKFNQNTKRNITKAQELNLSIEQVSISDSIYLSKEYLHPFLTSELHLSNTSLNIFNNLLINSKNYLYTFKVIDSKNQLKALAHFICNGKHALYLKGVNIDKKENTGSMHLLMAHAIDFFSTKATIFDFGGGSVSDSLANFYKGFGGQIMTYQTIKINKLPSIIKFFKK